MGRLLGSVMSCRTGAVLGLGFLALASGARAEVLHLISSEPPNQVAVSQHSDGGFSVAWVTTDPFTFSRSLYLERFDPQGVPSSPQRLVYEYPALGLWGVSTDSAGNDVVVWRVIPGFPHATDQSVAAAYSSSGEPLWGPSAVTPLSGIGRPTSSSVSLTTSPAGGWIVGWIEVPPEGPSHHLVQVRRLDPLSGPGEAMSLLDPALGRNPYALALGGSATRILATWAEQTGAGPSETATFEAFGQLLDGQGVAVAPLRPLGVAGIGPRAILNLEAAGFGEDRFFVAWNSQASAASPRSIGGLALNGDLPVAPAFAIRSSETTGLSPLSLGVDRQGRAILAWNEPLPDFPFPATSFVYRFAVTGAPLSDLVELSALPGYLPGAWPAVSTSSDGRWVAVWPRLADAEAPAGVDGLLGASADGCATEPHALCLTGNRFRVTATYHDHLGRDGVGVAVPLTSESGTFWFFSPESVELILKVVDACSHPDFGNFWVFASGLTDVEVHLTVIDTWTGESWERETALGEPFPPALDTAAFYTCAATPAISPTH